MLIKKIKIDQNLPNGFLDPSELKFRYQGTKFDPDSDSDRNFTIFFPVIIDNLSITYLMYDISLSKEPVTL